MDTGPRYTGPFSVLQSHITSAFPAASVETDDRDWREVFKAWLRGDGTFDEVMNRYSDQYQEGHELTHGETPYERRTQWTRGWWLHPFTFGLGFETQWDKPYVTQGEDVKWASLTLGFVTYTITRTRKSDRDYEEMKRWAARRH